MFKKIKEYILRDEIQKLSFERKAIEDTINQRIAEYVSKLDPFEPLMKKYNGIFSEEFEHPEDKMMEQEKVQMYMMAWRLKNDRYVDFLLKWVANTAGNSILKRGDPTPERILYARAQISNIILIKKEIGRLASNYEELLGKKDEEFDSSLSVEL